MLAMMLAVLPPSVSIISTIVRPPPLHSPSLPPSLRLSLRLSYCKTSIRLTPTRVYMRVCIMRVHERGTIEITRVLQQNDLQRGQFAFALTNAKAVLEN